MNYPIKLNNKLAHVLGVVQSSDNAPTQQSYMVYEDLATRVNAQLKTLNGLMTTDLGGSTSWFTTPTCRRYRLRRGGAGRRPHRRG